TTLALSEYPQMAGTASSILGTARYGFGGVAPPFVGLAGSLSILPLGVVTTGAALLALAAALLTLRRRGASAPAAARGPPGTRRAAAARLSSGAAGRPSARSRRPPGRP